MRKLAIALLVILPACQDPSLNIGATFDSGGVSMTPSVSGRAGGLGVAVSP